MIDENGKLKSKADMFSKRTIKPHKAVTSVDTASEALAVSIPKKPVWIWSIWNSSPASPVRTWLRN